MLKILTLAAITAFAFGTIERVAPSTAEAQASCHAKCEAKYPPGRSQALVQCKAKCKSG
jgi:hypothetical protein